MKAYFLSIITGRLVDGKVPENYKKTCAYVTTKRYTPFSSVEDAIKYFQTLPIVVSGFDDPIPRYYKIYVKEWGQPFDVHIDTYINTIHKLEKYQ